MTINHDPVFSEIQKINPSAIIELFTLELVVGQHIATGNPQGLPTKNKGFRLQV